MSTDALPLTDLVEHINQHEAQLAKLRQEFESRQSHLGKLSRRKEELQAQLQAVESEIKAIADVSSPEKAAAIVQPKKTAALKVVAKPKTEAKTTPTTDAGKATTLAGFILQCVAQARGPVTVKDLAAELVRQKYPTASSDIPGMIQTRMSEMVKKNILQRAGDQAGVVLSKPGAAAKPAAAKKLGRTGANAKKAPTTKQAASKKPGASPRKSLKGVLEEVLAKSPRPLTTNQLAEQVLATGYQTKSKDFNNVIWVAIGGMNNVKRGPGGYRLKKAKP